MPNEKVNVSQLAIKAGINVSTASRKLRAGKTPEQIIDEAQSWKETLAVRATRAKVQPGESMSYSEAQRLKEIALKNLRELEFQVKSGDLVPVAEINAWIAGVIVEARNILLRIGPDLRDRLAIETDPAEIDKLISLEVDRALYALKEYSRTYDAT